MYMFIHVTHLLSLFVPIMKLDLLLIFTVKLLDSLFVILPLARWTEKFSLS